MDWTHLLGPDPVSGLLVVLNLIVIESVLSVDNAAVLATMVMRLPEHQRGKALKYGIIGAYAFRGLCLVLAAWLMKIWWLEPVGGLYLLWLAWNHFSKHKSVEQEGAEAVEVEGNWLYRHTIGRLGPFWATVAAVEVMDLAFSIDNVVAAVAYVKEYPQPSKTVIVCLGVFLGILAMRFAAQGFVKLMHRYPFLETCAFLVIALLGMKLMLGTAKHLLDATHPFRLFLESKGFDLSVSLLTLAIFVLPLATQRLFNWPKRGSES